MNEATANRIQAERAAGLRDRLELAKAELAANRRTHAKFHACGVLVRVGYHPDDARKFSAERAIERAESRLSKIERDRS